ncbi:hypothetical protein ACFQYP_22280 [Nonomuraea antimicrobica]
MDDDQPRSRERRLSGYAAVSTSLALRGDHELAELLAERAVPLGSGIGGTSALLEVEGTPSSSSVSPSPTSNGSPSTRAPRPTCSACRPSASTASAHPASAPGGSSRRTR